MIRRVGLARQRVNLMAISNGVGAGVILSVMGGGVFTNVLAAPNAWPTEVLAPLFVCAGTEWLVPKSPVAFHSLGLLPVCIPF